MARCLCLEKNSVSPIYASSWCTAFSPSHIMYSKTGIPWSFFQIHWASPSALSLAAPWNLWFHSVSHPVPCGWCHLHTKAFVTPITGNEMNVPESPLFYTTSQWLLWKDCDSSFLMCLNKHRVTQCLPRGGRCFFSVITMVSLFSFTHSFADHNFR